MRLTRSSQVWDDAGLDSLTLVAHIPTNGADAFLLRFGETRTPLVKVEDSRMKDTGYSIYAGTAVYTWSRTRNPPGVSYDLIGSKDGKPVENTFNSWVVPFCRNS